MCLLGRLTAPLAVPAGLCRWRRALLQAVLAVAFRFPVAPLLAVQLVLWLSLLALARLVLAAAYLCVLARVVQLPHQSGGLCLYSAARLLARVVLWPSLAGTVLPLAVLWR